MTSSPKVQLLTLSGFRAYLYEQKISLGSGQSFVVFAPNGKGKSSLVDAIEFVLSSDGTVSRLGEKKSAMQGGREALLHHDAETRGIASFVEIDISQPQAKISFRRSPKTPEKIPDALQALIQAVKVPFIIRGFELRKFVEDESPQKRYEVVSRWFGFSPLLRTQDALRTLRLELKRQFDDQSTLTRLNQESNRITASKVPTWNEERAVEWFASTYIDVLDKSLKVASLIEPDDVRTILNKNATLESQRPNLAQYKSLLAQVSVVQKVSQPPSSALSPFDSVLASMRAVEEAQRAFDQAHLKSAQAAFNQIWTEAERILGSEKIVLEECPVCETPFSQTPAKSRGGIRVQLQVKLKELAELKKLELALSQSKKSLSTNVGILRDRVAAINTLSSTLGFTDVASSVTTFHGKLGQANQDIDSILQEGKTILDRAEREVDAFIKKHEAPVTKVTWASALSTFNTLVDLRQKVESEVRRRQQLQAICVEVTKQAGIVDREIKKYVDGLIGRLADLTNFYYKEIQAGSERIPRISLSLPDDKKAVQHALELLIDFADNRKGVPPAGYLSDSQVHTLALSLRFAAITLFNKGFPFVVLDDVVTSYDSDYRKAIAEVLAKHFVDQQVLVVTHDDQFFQLLNEHLSPSHWRFTRITKLDLNFGPKFSDHRVKDEQIDRQHENGDSSANLIRQAEEEWLTDICRGFGVDMRIREINRPYQYGRAELAMALHRFLGAKKIKPPSVMGYQNPFLHSLQQGTVENMGSHFSDNPNVTPSLGDEKKRWSDFKFFRGHFVCGSCGKGRFIRPEPVESPLCKGCNSPFAFKNGS